MTKKYTVGVTPDAPVVNSDCMFADFLESCIVEFLIIDDVPKSFGYLQSQSEKKLTVPGMLFQYGTQLLVNYTPFCIVSNPCTCPE